MAEEILIAELRVAHDKLRQDMQQATRDAERGSKDIADALNKINQSVKDLPASTHRYNSVMADMEKSSALAAESAKKSGNEIKELGNKVQHAGGQMGQFAGIMTSLKGTLAAFGLAHTISEFVQLGQAVFKSGEQLLGLEKRLEASTGSATNAANALAFVSAETDRLALNTLEGANSFAQLAAAAKGTAIEGKGVEIIFTGFSNAIRAAGKGSDEFQRVLNQVIQGISKGKVQMEDLMIISEAGIPIQRHLAEAMKITGEELSDAMQKGAVGSEAFVLAAAQLSREWQSTAEEMVTLVPAQFARMANRIKLEFAEIAAGVFESKKLIAAILPLVSEGDLLPDRSVVTKWVDQTIGDLTIWVSAFTTVFEVAKKVATNFIEDMKAPFKGLFSSTEEIDKTKIELEGLSQTLDDFQTKGFQGLIPKMLGVEDENDRKRIEDSINKVRELAGLPKIDFTPVINTNKVEDDVQKTTSVVKTEYQALEEYIAKLLEDRRHAPTKEQIEKQFKEAAKEAEKHAKNTIKSIKDNLQKEEQLQLEQNEKIRRIKERAAEDDKKRQRESVQYVADAARERLKIEEDAEKERQKILEETVERQREIFENMGENIQDELGDILTDVFSGQLNSIQDIADTIVDIFARTAAEIAVAMAIQPMIDKATTWLIGNEPGKIGGALGAGLDKLSFDAAWAPGGKVSGSQIIQGVTGIGAGVGVGAGVNQALGGGIAGGVVGGAVGGGVAGGAVAGAIWGSSAAPATFGLSIAIGAVIGALAGLTTALLDSKEKIEIAVRTGPINPNDTQFGYTTRGPFGNISLTDEGSNTSRSDTITVATIIAEADRAIAGFMSQRMRDIVSVHLEGQPFELDAKEMDDAVAQAIQTRLFIALRALTDENTAINIVGDPYTGTAANIDNIQKRAAEALAILKMVEDFKMGPLGDVAQAIKNVNEQFDLLILNAEALGLDIVVPDIEAERQRQLAQITSDFNTNIRDQILGFTDPMLQEAEAIKRAQDKIWADAVAAGADLAQVQELFALQWQDHNRRWADGGEASTAALESVSKAIEDFGSSLHSDAYNQLRALRERYLELKAEAEALGHSTEELTQSYIQQDAAIRDLVRSSIEISTLRLESPYLGAIAQWELDKAELNQLVADGIIDPELAQRNIDLMRANIDWQNAVALAAGNAQGPMAQFANTIEGFIAAGSNISSVDAAINAVIAQFQNLEVALLSLLAAGQITQGQFDAWMAQITQSRDNQIAQIQANEQARRDAEAARQQAEAARIAEQARREAEQRREQQRREEEQRREQQRREAEQRRREQEQAREQRRREAEQRRREREQVKKSIEQFETASLSGAGQQLANLSRSFIDLTIEANRLGVGTRDLTKSFRRQFEEIRRQAQEDVLGAIFAIANPFLASMLQVNQQIREFEKLANEGIISRSLVRDFSRRAREDVTYQYANQVASSGISTPKGEFQKTIKDFLSAGTSEYMQQIQELRTELVNLAGAMKIAGKSTKPLNAAFARQIAEITEAASREIYDEIESIVDPWAVSMRQINDETERFKQIANEDFISPVAVQQLRDLRMATSATDEALRRIGGGPVNQIGQIADAFEQFIQAGNPLSDAGQELFNLTENFINLVDAANLLGLSTEQLEASYLQQSKTIREKVIKDIDEQLSAQIDAIKSIDDYLSGLRLAQEQPLNIRLDEAQRQFDEALAGGEIDSMISAADQLRDIARQQFGSGAEFWNVENEIMAALGDVRAREQAFVEAERQRLTEQVDRELQQIQIGQSSLNYLQRIDNWSGETARGIDRLIGAQLRSEQREERTQAMLERVMIQIRA